MTRDLSVNDLKTFVPSKDYETSRSFYRDIGFKEAWTSPDLGEYRFGGFGFLLQNFYSKEMADNFMMSMMVEDLDAWWAHLEGLGLQENYPGVSLKPPKVQPWGLREVTFIDPAGVCWHVAHRPEQT